MYICSSPVVKCKSFMKGPDHSWRGRTIHEWSGPVVNNAAKWVVRTLHHWAGPVGNLAKFFIYTCRTILARTVGYWLVDTSNCRLTRYIQILLSILTFLPLPIFMTMWWTWPLFFETPTTSSRTIPSASTWFYSIGTSSSLSLQAGCSTKWSVESYHRSNSIINLDGRASTTSVPVPDMIMNLSCRFTRIQYCI